MCFKNKFLLYQKQSINGFRNRASATSELQTLINEATMTQHFYIEFQ